METYVNRNAKLTDETDSDVATQVLRRPACRQSSSSLLRFSPIPLKTF